MQAAGELKRAVEEQLAIAPAEAEPLQQRLQKLVSSSPVMLFMKGSPEAPRCGFSRKVAEALAGAGISYQHFDILGDEEVRQGLKEYSNWPTFPQVRGLSSCFVPLLGRFRSAVALQE
jgi:Grx4 family monothiol glutaredoxin